MGGAVTAHGNITRGGGIQHRLRSRSRAHRVRRVPAHRTGGLGSVMAHGFPHERFERWLQADVAARALLRRDLAQDARLGRRPPRRRLAFGRRAGDGAGAATRRVRSRSRSGRWRSNSRAAMRAAPRSWTGAARRGGRTTSRSCCGYDQARVRGPGGIGAGGRLRVGSASALALRPLHWAGLRQAPRAG